MSLNPKVQEIITKSAQYLTGRNFIDNPRFEAEILLCEAMKCKRIELYLKYDKPLQDNELEVMRAFLKRRGLGEPIAYILGRKGFFKHEFKVTPDTLIPRPETELLVEEVINRFSADKIYQIIDLGCGTGAIGLSLAASLPLAEVTLVDISKKALEVAKENAKILEVVNQCQFIEADLRLLSLPLNSFDIVVGNPPYISHNDTQVEAGVKNFEPQLALFAADNGMELLGSCIKVAKQVLKPNGLAILEHGHTQGEMVKKNYIDNGFKNWEAIKDLNSHWRHTLAFKE